MEIKLHFCFAPRLFASLFLSSAHYDKKKPLRLDFGPKFAASRVLIEDISSCHTRGHTAGLREAMQQDTKTVVFFLLTRGSDPPVFVFQFTKKNCALGRKKSETK